MKISELKTLERGILASVVLLQPCMIVQILNLMKCDDRLFLPTIPFRDMNKIIKPLETNGMIMKSKTSKDSLFIHSLTTVQLFELGCTVEFRTLLSELRTQLLSMDLNFQYGLEKNVMKQKLMHLLSGEILSGRAEEYRKEILFFSRFDHLETMKQQWTAFQYTVGKTDQFPARLDKGFFEILFPFMSWNSLVRGGSADSLQMKMMEYFTDKIPDSLLESYVLFLLWHGRVDELEKIRKRIIDCNAPEMAEAALSFLSGNMYEAADYYGRRIAFLKKEYGVNFDDYPPLLLITASLAQIATGKNPPKMSKFIQMVNENSQMNSFFVSTVTPANVLQQLADVIVHPENISANYAFYKHPPFVVMLRSLYFAKAAPEESNQGVVEKFWEIGAQLEKQGQNLTACYLYSATANLTSWNSPQRLKAEEFAEKNKLTPFFKMEVRKKKWETALDALSALISPQKNDSIPPPLQDMKITWHLQTGKQFMGESTVLYKIEAIVHTRLKNGGFSKGRVISLNRLADGEFDSFLTEREMFIRMLLQKDWAGRVNEIPPSAIQFLVGNKNVFVNTDTVPVEIAEGKNTIETYDEKDGSLSIEFLYKWGSPRDPTVYLYTSEDGVLRYILNSPELCKFSDFLEQYGTGSILTIPPEGEGLLTKILTPLVGKFHVTGKLQDVLLDHLPEEQAEILLCMRVHRDGEFMVFELKNQVFADSSSIMLTPGAGSRKLALSHNDARVVVVRDLKAEALAVDELLNKCPSLAAEEQSGRVWELDDPMTILSVLSELKESGTAIEWRQGDEVTVSPLIDSRSMSLRGGASASDWFTIGGEIKLDDGRIMELTELLALLPGRKGRFIALDDKTYLHLTKQLMKQLEVLDSAGVVRQGKIQMSPAALPMLGNTFSDGMPAFLQKHIDKIHEAFSEKIDFPVTFQGELRPYQQDGFEYLVRMANCRLGCCLADDMGLGKTIQILALLLVEAKNGAALVVAPASVCRNWESEARKFAPALNVTVLRNKDRETIIQSAKAFDLVITSYGLLLSEEELFSARSWNVIVLDEAQSIKNHTAKRSHSVKKLNGTVRIAATGTPVENRLPELWSIFDFLNPGLLGSEKAFEDKFCAEGVPTDSLKKLVSPLILRRMKTDVLDDLPPKQEITVDVELSEEERTLYEALRRKALEDLATGKKENRISILAHLTKLRRMCCHPKLTDENLDFAGSKLKRILELAQELHSGGHRALIFSQYVDFLHILRDELDKNHMTWQYLDGSTPSDERLTMVNDFQHGTGDFFLISLKAGGMGLNLTAANYVILSDPWWNPAVEDQAADRVYRIGQDNPVTVYRMMTTSTVEEKVVALHAKKRKLAEDILSDSNTSAISVDELLSLFEN